MKSLKGKFYMIKKQNICNDYYIFLPPLYFGSEIQSYSLMTC